MDENYSYFYKKAKGRINGFLWICIIGSLIAEFFVIKYNAEGRYDDSSTVILVPLVCVGFILLYNIVLKGLLKLSCKSQTWAALGIVFAWPMGLYFYWPMLRYHRGDEPGNGDYTDKAFKLTVKAYQKAWAKQCFAQRVLYPVVLFVLLIAGFINERFSGYAVAVKGKRKLAHLSVVLHFVCVSVYAVRKRLHKHAVVVEFKDKLGIQFRRKKACGGIGGSSERYFRAVYLQASAFQRINRYGNAIHVAKPNGCAREVYGIAAYFRVFNGGSRGSGSLRSCRRRRT